MFADVGREAGENGIVVLKEPASLVVENKVIYVLDGCGPVVGDADFLLGEIVRVVGS